MKVHGNVKLGEIELILGELRLRWIFVIERNNYLFYLSEKINMDNTFVCIFCNLS